MEARNIINRFSCPDHFAPIANEDTEGKKIDEERRKIGEDRLDSFKDG